VSAPVHHHYVHRIVGRIRPRRAPIHKIAAHPINPDGCAQPTAGALNTPRPSGIAAGGLGAGKIASVAGVGGAAAIGSLLPPGKTTPVSVLTPPIDPGSTGTPIITGGTPPIIVPPSPPVVLCTHPSTACKTTPPVSVSEPATLVVFVMALAVLFIARGIAGPRMQSALAH